MSCSAVLLAGGRSSRMGRDKALIEIGGTPLWRHQVETLRRLAPAELFISGREDAAWSDFEAVKDRVPGAGPLAGIAAALERISTSHLVVLAVDLPNISPAFLLSLLALCGNETGAVPKAIRGFEPLAAVYPADCRVEAAKALQSGDLSMQSFVRGLVAANLMVERPVAMEELPLFKNLNTPADL